MSLWRVAEIVSMVFLSLDWRKPLWFVITLSVVPDTGKLISATINAVPCVPLARETEDLGKFLELATDPSANSVLPPVSVTVLGEGSSEVFSDTHIYVVT